MLLEVVIMVIHESFISFKVLSITRIIDAKLFSKRMIILMRIKEKMYSHNNYSDNDILEARNLVCSVNLKETILLLSKLPIQRNKTAIVVGVIVSI